MKRIFAVILLVIMVLSLFVGCTEKKICDRCNRKYTGEGKEEGDLGVIFIICPRCVEDLYGSDGSGYDSGWDDYDYDDDGDINQREWEDALGDYMDSIMD